jgi:hypothetical protein
LVNLDLEMRNRSDRECRLFIGTDWSELFLDLQGPGVVTAESSDSFGAAFLVPKTVTLAPGQHFRLPITRLVYGSRRRVQYAYWVEAGEYTLSLRYKAIISPAPGGAARPRLPAQYGDNANFVLLRCAPMKFLVQPEP